jgi:ParB-like nuclease domain
MNALVDEMPIDNMVLLTGRPPLAKFIRYIRGKTVNGLRAHEGELAAQWWRGREAYRRLETDEAGWADNPQLEPLPEAMNELAELGLKRPSILRLRHYAPREWRMVEIDRLVVFQHTINLRFVDEIKATLPSPLLAEHVMRVAVGNTELRRPAVRAIQSADNAYSFSSASNDLRFLDVVTLDASSIQDYQPSGRASNAIVIFVGFSDNLITAVHAGNRVFLANGSHRVYALRELGVTHVPCLVTRVTREEEFELVLPADVKQDREQYMRSPRPSVFKDYFDDRVRTIVPVMRMNHVLEATLSLEKAGVPAVT